jgi:hypothetical protein
MNGPPSGHRISVSWDDWQLLEWKFGPNLKTIHEGAQALLHEALTSSATPSESPTNRRLDGLYAYWVNVKPPSSAAHEIVALVEKDDRPLAVHHAEQWLKEHGYHDYIVLNDGNTSRISTMDKNLPDGYPL